MIVLPLSCLLTVLPLMSWPWLLLTMYRLLGVLFWLTVFTTLPVLPMVVLPPVVLVLSLLLRLRVALVVVTICTCAMAAILAHIVRVV